MIRQLTLADKNSTQTKETSDSQMTDIG